MDSELCRSGLPLPRHPTAGLGECVSPQGGARRQQRAASLATELKGSEISAATGNSPSLMMLLLLALLLWVLFLLHRIHQALQQGKVAERALAGADEELVGD